MSIKDISMRLAAVSLIADEAKKAKDKLRVELQALMDDIGADRVKGSFSKVMDGGIKEVNCRHIYEEVGEDYCPDCGKWTNRFDWQLQNKLNTGS